MFSRPAQLLSQNQQQSQNFSMLLYRNTVVPTTQPLAVSLFSGFFFFNVDNPFKKEEIAKNIVAKNVCVYLVTKV